MAKQHKFLVDAFKDGHLQFKAGESYPASEATAVYVATGRAEEIDVADEKKDDAQQGGDKPAATRKKKK